MVSFLGECFLGNTPEHPPSAQIFVYWTHEAPPLILHNDSDFA